MEIKSFFFQFTDACWEIAREEWGKWKRGGFNGGAGSRKRSSVVAAGRDEIEEQVEGEGDVITRAREVACACVRTIGTWLDRGFDFVQHICWVMFISCANGQLNGRMCHISTFRHTTDEKWRQVPNLILGIL